MCIHYKEKEETKLSTHRKRTNQGKKRRMRGDCRLGGLLVYFHICSNQEKSFKFASVPYHSEFNENVTEV